MGSIGDVFTLFTTFISDLIGLGAGSLGNVGETIPEVVTGL